MTAIEPRAALRAAIERAHKNLVNDLNATPDEKLNSGSGGVSRPAIEIVVECGSVNSMIAGALGGVAPPRPDPEQRKAFFASFQTKESALTYLEQQTQQLLAAVDGVDVDTLGDMVETPLGPMTRFGLTQLSAMHMMYHDGQLNYIHALHGDPDMHW